MDEAGTEGAIFLFDQSAQGGHALLHGGAGDGLLAVQVPAGRARARGEREQVEIGEGLGGDEVEMFLELAISFAGEADHDVGADSGMGRGRADGGEALGVVPGAVAAVHTAQDRVRAGLQREMNVARETRVRAARPAAQQEVHALGPVHGLHGTDAKARDRGGFKDFCQQVFKAGLRCEIATPTAKIDAGDSKLLASGADEIVDRANDFVARQGAAVAAGGRDDAESAAIAAAVLNFQGWASPMRGKAGKASDDGCGKRWKVKVCVGEDVVGQNVGGHPGCFGEWTNRRADHRGKWDEAGLWGMRCILLPLEGHRRDLLLVAVANDGEDAGQRRNFLGSALGVAAGDDDADARILTLGAADIGAGVPVRFGGDGAGVHHDDIGMLGIDGRGGTEAFQLCGDGVAVRLTGATTEIFYMKTIHTASVATTPGSSVRLGTCRDCRHHYRYFALFGIPAPVGLH
jgi:hypothetical protein